MRGCLPQPLEENAGGVFCPVHMSIPETPNARSERLGHSSKGKERRCRESKRVSARKGRRSRRKRSLDRDEGTLAHNDSSHHENVIRAGFSTMGSSK